MNLDFTSFKKALASLEKAISRSQDSPKDEELRDCVIQRFEYTYELSWKMLKRKLETLSASPAEVDAYSFKDLIREGAIRGLIKDPEAWFEYRTQRNATSHAYDEKKAAQVYQTTLKFVGDAQSLLNNLQSN